MNKLNTEMFDYYCKSKNVHILTILNWITKIAISKKIEEKCIKYAMNTMVYIKTHEIDDNVYMILNDTVIAAKSKYLNHINGIKIRMSDNKIASFYTSLYILSRLFEIDDI
jgi:hypothetical protein